MTDKGGGVLTRIAIVLLLLPALALSCGGEKKADEETAAEQAGEAREFASEEVSYGLFFDEEGTKRTITLEKGQDEFMGYLYLMLPDYLEIASTQFRLEMPDGVTIENDKYRMDRIMSLGTFHRGLSERFSPCLSGSKVLLHTFTFKTAGPLSNASFTIMSDVDAQFLAVAECREGFPLVKAAAYKAVVNPTE